MDTRFHKTYQWAFERGLMEAGLNLETETYNILEEVFELNGYKVKNNKRFKRTLKPFLKVYTLIFRLLGLIKKVEITEDTVNDASMDIVVFASQIPYKQGYDTDKCYDETLKEISSRVGEINESTGKWEKRTDAIAKGNWYKARYSICYMLDA